MRTKLKAQINEAAPALASLMGMPHPSLGVDLDGCIDECPVFFKLLTGCWPDKVFVITWRTDRRKAEADLAKFGVRYDELVFVNSFDEKVAVIGEKGILVYFDDQAEALRNVPPSVNIMLVRNGGNFDFDDKLWLFSHTTGRKL